MNGRGTHHTTLFERIFDFAVFKDSKGKLVLWQAPNLYLYLWIACTILRQFKENPVFEVVGFGALFTWSMLELTSGVTLFRRLLGLIILIVTIGNRI